MDDDQPGDDPLSVLRPAARAPASVRWRIAAGAAVLMLLAGLGVAAAIVLLAPGGTTRPVPAVQLTTTAPTTAAPGSAVVAPSPSVPAGIFVHVLGQVRAPGLFELSAGSRVIDAVSAAGGLTPVADPAGVNLARLLSDGEQLYVPKRGEAPPAGIGGAAGGAADGGSGAPAGKVNLNSATVEQLEALPRIGPAMAQRIIDWRSAHGRFGSVDDLKNVTGIGEKTFDGLKDLITV